MPGSLIDHELLDAVEASECKSLEVDIWRVAWKGQDVLRGGPKGRWNPKSFTAPVLYTSCEMDGAVAEVYSLLSKQPVFSSADKLIYRLKACTRSTLVLNNTAKLSSVGVDLFGGSDNTLKQCQSVGEAAYRLDYDSLLVPSVRWECENLILFPDLIDPNDIQIEGEPREINWPAWAEKNIETSRDYRRRMRKR